MSTNLIDTYVSEVGRRLPRKTRADIEAEIRSILQDMLEERSQKTDKPVDEEMTLEVLKSYGDPEKVAATYMGERYLIGPRLYPIFMLVLRIVLVVTGILALVGLGIAFGQSINSQQNAFETVIKAIANFSKSLMTALGNIVLIFAIIEWAIYHSGGKAEVKNFPNEKEWDPHSLTKISLPQQVRLGETIAEILLCFAAIVIFNFYPQVIGITPSLNSVVEYGSWTSVTFIPLLSTAFFTYVPYLTLSWGLTIFLDIVLLRQGYWNTVTRIFSIGLKLIYLILVVAMLFGPSLISITTETITASFGYAGEAQILITLLSQFVHIVLWILVILGILDVVRLIYRLILSKRLPLVAIEKE